MTAVQIPCPQCGKRLRVSDKSWIGRKVRCKQCQHRFVLSIPTEGDKLVPPDTVPAETVPPVGTHAQWVPDEQPTPNPTLPFDPTQTVPAAALTPPIITDAPIITETRVSTESSDGLQRLREIRRKSSRRSKVALLVSGITALAAGLVYAFFIQPTYEVAQLEKATVAARETMKPGPVEDFPEPGSATNRAVSPTAGEPIDFRFIPYGCRVVVHLRPATLWSPESLGEEVRYCLGPIGSWATAKLQEVCRHEPAQIEEALICLIPQARGYAPDIAVTVKLVDEVRRSKLIQELGGTRSDEFGHPVYLSETQAFVIRDERTLTFGPRDSAREMAEAATKPNVMSVGIDKLIPSTDRDRHLTIIFEPGDVQYLAEFLVPPESLTFFESFLSWFTDQDIETVGFSCHFDQEFFAELLVRSRTPIPEWKLQAQTEARLNELPQHVLQLVEKMDPKKLGNRQIIGRYPAMLKVLALATKGSVGDYHARLATTMPDRAAPNLAIGSLLTWDESTRTDFNTTPARPRPSSAGTRLPAKVADRLQLPIDAEFQRTPLQEAFSYIAEETKTTIEIDGDALKFAGYTKNMPQTFNLGRVPAITAIAEILKKYDQMAIVIDEDNQSMTVMTKTFAEKNGLTPYVLP